jgi:hypothetical protein
MLGRGMRWTRQPAPQIHFHAVATIPYQWHPGFDFGFSEFNFDGRVETGILRFGPVPQRGDTRSSRPRGGMRWTLIALRTNALERTAKSCGPDAPTLASSSRKQLSRATVANKPGHRGEYEGNR